MEAGESVPPTPEGKAPKPASRYGKHRHWHLADGELEVRGTSRRGEEAPVISACPLS